MNKIKLIAACMMLMSFGAVAVSAADLNSVWPASSLQQTEAQTCLIGGVKNEVVSISSSDIERRLGMEDGSIKTVTVLSTPKASQGQLTIDGVEVGSYTRIKREDLDRMIFVPAPDSEGASMTILPDGTTKAVLSIALTDGTPTVPTAADAQFDTRTDVPVTDRLPVGDAGGEQLTCRVTKQPTKGQLKVEGTTFSYEPYPGEKGKDTFDYCVTDENGYCSEQATVTIQVEQFDGVSFSDMEGNANRYAAEKLSQAGVMTGETIGNISLFDPDRAVTREEFAVMLTAIMDPDTSAMAACVNTGLSDDQAIPTWEKPYISAAKQAGILAGESLNGSEVLTRAEALVMADRVTQTQSAQRISLGLQDATEVPEWATQTYMNWENAGMLYAPTGNAQPNEPLTRDYAASILWQVWQSLEQ
nr:S-layer homology domain-containing protein [uncultured Solibaculum sp.]